MSLLIGTCGCALLQTAEEDIIHIESHFDRRLAEKANAEGLHWLDYGDKALAMHKFEHAIAADETYGPPHNNLGQMHFDAHDMYEAALAFDRAARLMPNNPVPHSNLGLALETGGRLEEAIGHYQRAHELDPANEHVLGNLVRARMRLDPWDESVVGQLRELQFIETRPHWIEWIEEQLAIRYNPMLDRGPPGPEFSGLDEQRRTDGVDDREESPIIDELTPLEEPAPLPEGAMPLEPVPAPIAPEGILPEEFLPPRTTPERSPLPAHGLIVPPSLQDAVRPAQTEEMGTIQSPSRITSGDEGWAPTWEATKGPAMPAPR